MSNRSNSKKKRKIKFLAIAYKGGKCQCCGYKKSIGALEFHHTNPSEKDFGISTKGYTRSWEKTKEELDKCILVCANCHREIHEGITPCPDLNIKDEVALNSAEKEFEKLYNC